MNRPSQRIFTAKALFLFMADKTKNLIYAVYADEDGNTEMSVNLMYQPHVLGTSLADLAHFAAKRIAAQTGMLEALALAQILHGFEITREANAASAEVQARGN